MKRAAKLADAWFPSPMVSEENVGKLSALFRETRAAAGLPPATEYPIIRECHRPARSTRCASRCPSSTRPMRAGAASRASCRPIGIRADFDKFAANRFLIGSESELVEQIGRYGERTGTDHILLRVQWPGLDQKVAVRTLERLGRVVEQLR